MGASTTGAEVHDMGAFALFQGLGVCVCVCVCMCVCVCVNERERERERIRGASYMYV